MSETVEQRSLRWLASGDTGASSKTILRHMLGLPQDGYESEPADEGDLGRCLRLLRLIPEWQPRMAEMAELSNAWAALVPHWDELAALLVSEIGEALPRYAAAPTTYERIRALAFEARRKDGWVSMPSITGASIRARR